MNVVLADELKKCIIESLIDGDGIRLTIFFAGCPHACFKCHNKRLWEISNGVSYPVEEVVNYITELLDVADYDGITFSGGDPLIQSNEMLEIVSGIKRKHPNINIWCYTGFLYEQVKELSVISKIDVLVDGPFMYEKMVERKPYRGSSNQRLLYLNNGEIINEI